MGKKGTRIAYTVLLICAAVGAAGYGISTWKMVKGNQESPIMEASVRIIPMETVPIKTDEVSAQENTAKQPQQETKELPQKEDAGLSQEKIEELDREGGSAAAKERKDLEESDEGIVFSYVSEKTAVPELSDAAALQAERINHGEELDAVTGMEELKSYYALIGIKGIIAQDKKTGEAAAGGGEVTLYVPNLIKGLKNISLLFYSRESQDWEMIPVPENTVEPEEKLLTVKLPGDGLLTVIYQRE